MDGVESIEGAAKKFFGERVFDVFFNTASQWSSSVIETVSGFAFIDDEASGFVGEDHLLAAFAEAF